MKPRSSLADARFFPWPEVDRARRSMDPSVSSLSVQFAQEDLGGQAKGCPLCHVPAADAEWISIGTSDEAWSAGDERCGWLLVCRQCGIQVDFVVDEEMTQLRREGNW